MRALGVPGPWASLHTGSLGSAPGWMTDSGGLWRCLDFLSFIAHRKLGVCTLTMSCRRGLTGALDAIAHRRLGTAPTRMLMFMRPPHVVCVCVCGCLPTVRGGVPLRDAHAACVFVRNDSFLCGSPGWWLPPIGVVSRSGIPVPRVNSLGIICF